MLKELIEKEYEKIKEEKERKNDKAPFDFKDEMKVEIKNQEKNKND